MKTGKENKLSFLENKLSFLDIKIIRKQGKFTTAVYRKHTFTSGRSNFESFLYSSY